MYSVVDTGPPQLAVVRILLHANPPEFAHLPLRVRARGPTQPSSHPAMHPEKISISVRTQQLRGGVGSLERGVVRVCSVVLKGLATFFVPSLPICTYLHDQEAAVAV